MKRMTLIACAALSILLISPVTTWAGSCPDGQQKNDRSGDCEPIRGWKGNITKGPLTSGSGWRFERSLPVGAKKHCYQVISAPDYPIRYGQNS